MMALGFLEMFILQRFTFDSLQPYVQELFKDVINIRKVKWKVLNSKFIEKMSKHPVSLFHLHQSQYTNGGFPINIYYQLLKIFL